MKIIPISGTIGSNVIPNDIRQLLTDAAGEDIEIHISSPGGYIYDGVEIFNLIRNYPGNKTARIIGMAASMASYIPLAADKVIAESNAIYMIHNARAYSGGDQNAHQKIAKILTGMSNLLAQEYISKTGKPKKEISKMMDDETYLFGNEILEAGFVDEIVQVNEEKEAARDDIIIDAMMKVEACDNRLNANPEKIENINKIAAIMAAQGDSSQPVTPVTNNQNHGERMTFEEYLAKYPEEKARIEAWLQSEYEAETEDVRAKAFEDARQEVETGKLTKAEVEFVAKVIESEEYHGTLKGVGVKVLTGEREYQNFEDMVAQEDRFNEKIKSLKVSGNQPPATPGEVHEPGTVDQNKIKADAQRLGQKFGTVKKEDK